MEWAAAGSRSGLSTKWYDLASSPSVLSDVDWDADPTTTTVEADVNWSSTGSAWMSGFPSNNFAVELNATITVPTTGTWTFYLNSDDGSELVLDGSDLIDNDGLHGMRERSASKAMAADEAVPIRIRFFERGGGAGLILSWSGPGQSKQVVPSSAFSYGDAVSGDGPARIALYEFDEQAVIAPALIGHWEMDEVAAAAGSGGVSAGDKIEVKGSGRVDSYNSSAGTYASQSPGNNAIVTVNSTSSDKFKVEGSGYVGGDGYIGAGGNTSSVFKISGTLTGSRLVQSSDIAIARLSAPSGMPSSSGNFSKSSGNTTISSNKKYSKFTLSSSARVTISGDVTMWVTGDFKMKGSSQLIIPDGSSLTLYTGDDLDVESSAVMNGDSSDPAKLTIYAYGEKHVDLKGIAEMAAIVYTNDDFHIKGSSHFYGIVLADEDVKIEGSAEFHQDLALGGFGSGGGGGGSMPDAVDESATGNDGTYVGDATGGAVGFGDGATAVTFDGSGDYLEIPHDASYLLDRGSVGLHFRADSLGGHQAIFSKDSNGNDNGGHLHIYCDGSALKALIQTTSDDPYGTGSSVTLASSGSALTD